jgi:hypothetical protein
VGAQVLVAVPLVDAGAVLVLGTVDHVLLDGHEVQFGAAEFGVS